MNIGIIANTSKEELANGLDELIKTHAPHADLLFEAKTAKLIGQEGITSCQELSDQVDMIIVLGGDGTIIDTVHRLDRLDTPIAGINFGHLGFLTTITKDELSTLVDAVTTDNYRLSKRSLLSAEVFENGQKVYESIALNEASVSRANTGKMAAMDVYVEDQLLNHYCADGILFATPTGSTAYSLSAGGPIMSPATPAIIIAPVSPHSLSNRPVVISDESSITLRPDPANEGELLLSCDGREPFTLNENSELRISKHDQTLSLVRLQERNFYRTLRTKMHWYTNLRKPEQY